MRKNLASHLACGRLDIMQAQFDAIRYFLNEPTNQPGIRRTRIKDFRKGAEKISSDDRRFLQQYMTTGISAEEPSMVDISDQ